MNKEEFCAKAVGPLDGRYFKVGTLLGEYFSEYALVKQRVFVEAKWLCFLMGNENLSLNFSQKERQEIALSANKIADEFDFSAFEKVKEIEEKTKHDVKAVEYFLDRELKNLGLEKATSFVHIGCTSEDINNLAYALMIKDCLQNVWLPKAQQFLDLTKEFSKKYCDIAMLAHTHGQPATPTTVGKEFRVFSYRLEESLEHIKNLKIKAKFNGATGNYSALSVAYQNIDWEECSEKFVKSLELDFNPFTTQIEGHDYVCHILDGVRNFNNIVADLDVDMWLYISKDYFKQIAVKGEVGSSTMPHKVNPIKFENSEANVDLSNALCVALSNKLPKSRLQRDLSDSSSKRNIGLAFGYSLQAINEAIEGLKKCVVNEAKIQSDLDGKWEVLAETIQTMLRKYGIADAYEKLKDLTRGKNISKEDIKSFVQSITCMSKKDKEILQNLSPKTYIGYASKLAKK